MNGVGDIFKVYKQTDHRWWREADLNVGGCKVKLKNLIWEGKHNYSVFKKCPVVIPTRKYSRWRLYLSFNTFY